MIQGNSIVSPGFVLIVIMLIRDLEKAGLSLFTTSLITKFIYQLAGQIFVDDSDFNIMNTGIESEAEVVTRA